jgi:hypothetical protein
MRKTAQSNFDATTLIMDGIRREDAMRPYSMLALAICVLDVALTSPVRAVDGAVTLACPAPSADLRRAIKWARTTTASDAFAICLDQAMRKGRPGPYGQIGPYRPCAYTVGGKLQAGYLDPFFKSDIGTQVGRALSVTRSPNAILINCPAECTSANTSACYAGQKCLPSGYCTSGTFSAGQPASHYATTAPEELTTQVAPIQWDPASEGSAVIHEIMHQHGYLHGSTDTPTGPDDLPGSCGYDPNDKTFTSRSSIPYIVEDCIELVLGQSHDKCGGDSFETSCGNGGMKLVSSPDKNDCTCVPDPQPSGKVGGAPAPESGGNGGCGNGQAMQCTTFTNGFKWCHCPGQEPKPRTHH